MLHFPDIGQSPVCLSRAPWPFFNTRQLKRAGPGFPGTALCSSIDQRISIGLNTLSVAPTNSDCGRINRLFDTCSMTWALYPTDRETANVGVNMSPGSPTAARTAAE